MAENQELDVIVVGNVTLDVICYPVDDVPRYESISFERADVAPGGCGSNTAIGLAALGQRTALVACCGEDDTADLLLRYWRRVGVDTRYIVQVAEVNTGVSVGLVDHDYQPRFVHTSGANAHLGVEKLDLSAYATSGARFLHVAGYFVLPGLYHPDLAKALAQVRAAGMHTSLDVVTSPRMDDPSPLYPCLPHLDVLMCNAYEAKRITGIEDPQRAALWLRQQGANAVIVKLGAQGCWVDNDAMRGAVPAPRVDVVDTTGAGDAFAAGYIAALAGGADVGEACAAGNRAGARVVTRMGAVRAWLEEERGLTDVSQELK